MRIFKALRKIDQFGYRYELGFNGSDAYRTYLGGSFTVMLGLLVVW
jgi:hypothetical protein